MIALGVVAVLCFTTFASAVSETTTLTAMSETTTLTATYTMLTTCDQTIHDLQFLFPLLCEDHGQEECPAGCHELIEQLHVNCDGSRVDLFGSGDDVEYPLGIVTRLVYTTLYETPCEEAPIHALFNSTVPAAPCVDALYILTTLLIAEVDYVSACQALPLDNSSCPEECGRVLGDVLATCSAAQLNDTLIDYFGLVDAGIFVTETEVSAEGFLAMAEPLLNPPCAALLQLPFAQTSSTGTMTTGSTTTTTGSTATSGSSTTSVSATTDTGSSTTKSDTTDTTTTGSTATSGSSTTSRTATTRTSASVTTSHSGSTATSFSSTASTSDSTTTSAASSTVTSKSLTASWSTSISTSTSASATASIWASTATSGSITSSLSATSSSIVEAGTTTSSTGNIETMLADTTSAESITTSSNPCTYEYLTSNVLQEACVPVGGTCPAACRAQAEHLYATCKGAQDFSLALMAAGRASEPGGACWQVAVDAGFNSTAQMPACVDGLSVLLATLQASLPECGDSGEPSCPEACQRVLGTAFGYCAEADTRQTLAVHGARGTAGEVAMEVDALLSSQCSSVLRSTAWGSIALGGSDSNRSTTNMAFDTTDGEFFFSTAILSGTSSSSSSVGLRGTSVSSTSAMVQSISRGSTTSTAVDLEDFVYDLSFSRRLTAPLPAFLIVGLAVLP